MSHFGPKKLSPAAKIALKSLILGLAKSNNQAAIVSGMSPAWVSVVKNSPAGQEFMSKKEKDVDEKLLETSALMDLLGREALQKMGGLMRWSQDEGIVLRAAADLMDRSPVTQKVAKVSAESFTINSKDVAEMAKAMVESARERARFMDATQGDYVKIADQVEVVVNAE